MKQTKNNADRPWSRYLIFAGAALLLLIGNYFYFVKRVSSNEETITQYHSWEDPMEKYRNPAVAGLFYPQNGSDLATEVDSYLAADYRPHAKRPQILVVPHAGYQYSAAAAAQAYAPLKDFAKDIKTVILLGPSHYVALDGAALSNDDYFQTPLGKLEINKEINRKLAKENGFAYNNNAHRREHSLEVQLPFLQRALSDFSIVPIVYGDANPQDLADALRPWLQRDDTLLVVSADLSHYNNYNAARVLDQDTAQKIAEGKPEVDYHHSCGATGINAALILAQTMQLHPRLLSLINSGDTAGDRDKVVGYGAWSFSVPALEEEMESLRQFAADYKGELLKIARNGLEQAVSRRRRFVPSRRDYSDDLFNRGAAFVTLTSGGNLRGCIGSLYPHQAIAADVAEHAYDAALADGRFAAVTPDELKDIRLSISLLSGYREIEYKDEADLLAQLQPGTDGVVIRDGNRQGLFLPSVWRQLPERKDFLQNLKIKAGINPGYWSEEIKVYRFRTAEITE